MHDFQTGYSKTFEASLAKNVPIVTEQNIPCATHWICCLNWLTMDETRPKRMSIIFKLLSLQCLH